MRKSVLVVAVVLVGVIWGSLSTADDEMCVPMGEITLHSLASEAKRSDVAFPHNVHFNYACQKCHHQWDAEGSIQSCTTSGCHDLAQAPMNEKGRPVMDPVQKVRYFKNAFHNMCIGCHKEIKMKNSQIEASKAALGETLAPTGPTGCSECHPNERF